MNWVRFLIVFVTGGLALAAVEFFVGRRLCGLLTAHWRDGEPSHADWLRVRRRILRNVTLSALCGVGYGALIATALIVLCRS